MNYMQKLAKEYPDVKFEHATGYKTAPNMTNYNIRFYEGRYLAGMCLPAVQLRATSSVMSLRSRFRSSAGYQRLYIGCQIR